ncbi:MAG: dTMP kinase [Candidatus Gastranaerophilales bacterium]|nr:dTMP kinase [Candidatus Gastranaerophilales bacterium]
MKKGLFITFEGADGCGKTTQLNKTAELLENMGYDVVKTLEPGALEIGSKIRNILLHYDGVVADNCEMFLFLADRAQHSETFIKPAIEQGKIVLCDRHTDSTLAYQGYGRGQDIEKLDKLNKIAVNGLVPDLTLLFDVDTDIAQTRVGKEKDRLEAAGIEFHKKVRQGYLELAKKSPERIKVINANNSIETVYNDTKDIIIDLCNKMQNK